MTPNQPSSPSRLASILRRLLFESLVVLGVYSYIRAASSYAALCVKPLNPVGPKSSAAVTCTRWFCGAVGRWCSHSGELFTLVCFRNFSGSSVCCKNRSQRFGTIDNCGNVNHAYVVPFVSSRSSPSVLFLHVEHHKGDRLCPPMSICQVHFDQGYRITRGDVMMML